MVAVFLIILFAINYSIYRTNKKIAEDLQRIKEK
jgi:cbb3-type cytochrome oxidase subunit 3